MAVGEGGGDRRTGVDRRGGAGRRATDRQVRPGDVAATLLAFCGGLAVLFIFFAVIGTVDLGDAIGATIAAVLLALIWLVGVWQRARTGGIFVTRRERERRGF